MKREVLEAMSDSELDNYAKMLDTDVGSATTHEEKIALIEEARERIEDVVLFGEHFSITMKAARDQRIPDLFNKPTRTDEDMKLAARLLLGDEQYDKIIELCTDDDGTIDSSGLGLAMVELLGTKKVKN